MAATTAPAPACQTPAGLSQPAYRPLTILALAGSAAGSSVEPTPPRPEVGREPTTKRGCVTNLAPDAIMAPLALRGGWAPLMVPARLGHHASPDLTDPRRN